MTVVLAFTPDTAYASKPNIVHPEAVLTDGAAHVDAREVFATAELNARWPSVTVSATSIKRGAS